MASRAVFFAILVFLATACHASADWDLYEHTRVKGRLNGVTKEGSRIEMQSGSSYEISEAIEQGGAGVALKVTVMRDGVRFLVAIEGFSKSLICKQITPPRQDPNGVKPAATSPTRTPSRTLDTDPLAQLMPPSKQRQIGVGKLTKEEQTSLRLFLIELYLRGVQDGKAQAVSRMPKAPMPSGNATVSRGGSPPRGGATVSAIESKVDGEFEGWKGETVVKLTNGQIWQQTEFYYHYHYAYMPDVLIYRSGTHYKMRVEGIDNAVTVERIK